MDFSNQKLCPFFRLGGHVIYVTETMRSTWIIMGVLIVLAVFIRLRMKKFVEGPAPNSLQNVVEMLVESMSRFAESNLGKDFSYLGAYFFGAVAFILISNYAGLFALRPPTADLATTFPLALNTFILIHVMGIAKRKKKYFEEYMHPHFVFLPIHIVSELSRPISLSFRLFGNILGGEILLGLTYASLPIIFRFVVPDVLHFYLDIFAGSLQAFIFTVLSMTFIREKAVPDDD